MVAAKKAPAKKVAAAKKAAAKPAAESTRSLGANDPDFIAEVVELRDEQELKWSEIATQLGCTPGKAMLAHLIHNVAPKDRIKGANDEELGEKIVSARDDDNLSWGVISARAGIPESKVRKLYAETSGVDSRGLRIGKGGRYPAGADRPEKAPVAKKTAAAKKAPASKKAAAVKAPAAKKALGDMDQAEIKARLDGKTITRPDSNGKAVKIKVAKVTKLNGDELSFTDGAGKGRTVLVSEITAATR